ncbi:PREDICTED: uncharacterized protein LOC105955822 [Erythranthe guttata]|uniref:uncharacterized protein LOC105955822 n=1 Tax=Erythranthe guttata TaxID=4155 RepID=UPI00064D7785|nr:PREDICTED: uncharacterized protein LOC105955822 [Erythranthe guttata]XP_012835074.1 PREDICTED: uncharacterized protein LOC105955822 [Erythranthe guttata]|eukprot:XP_012835073.1 PREDICTED: uncharacterized protein LOC105955822 [Erythranthe guttata]
MYIQSDVRKGNAENVLTKEIVAQHRYLIFPLHSETNPSARYNHWTLLVVDMKSNEWKYYNSSTPRTAATSDVYINDANDMKTYVEETALVMGLSRIPIGQPLKVELSPQQKAGSTDCGVIVLYIIREYFLQMPLEVKEAEEGVAEMRKDIVVHLLNYKIK